MHLNEHRFVPVEFKFVGDNEPGVFDGYGAVFGNVDSHGDMIVPGAFAKSLAAHKASGTMPGLYIEHGQFTGGDPMPAGKYLDMSEDDKGLRVKGKISALDTDYGKRVRGLMQDGALDGLSIAYTVPPGGSVPGKKASDPKRTLKEINLHAVDIVRDPSNSIARVDAVKSILAMGDHDAATKAVASAIALHRASTAGGDSPTADERAALLQHLQDAHKALTGMECPAGTKSVPQTIRELENFLRDGGFSHSQARLIAEGGFKTSLPRDEAGETAAKAKQEALEEIGASLKAFTLPTLK